MAEHRSVCKMYDEVYMGNPGAVPYCKKDGELEPDCLNCNKLEYNPAEFFNRKKSKQDKYEGKWIKADDTFWCVRCSNCGELGYKDFKFCPQCGSRNILKGS